MTDGVDRLELDQLGSLRSTHAAPPLPGALVGPVLIAAMVLAGCRIAGLPMLAAVAAATVTLVVLAASPLRAQGRAVSVHDRGLVVVNRGVRSIVAFEDVNEVWFVIPWLHSGSGAYLSAMRLVGFDGRSHHVPAAVGGGLELTIAILRGCSEPLLREAKHALAEGAMLTFGGVRIDRSGVTQAGAQMPWSEIRRAVVSHARLHLYRRNPLLAWRTTRLDRIPNPAVLACLVAQCVGEVRIANPLILPLAADSDAARARLARESGTPGLRDIATGGVICAAGIAVSMLASAHAGRSYLVFAFGPIVYGALRFFRGLVAWLQRGDR